jgi:hypothetical protein
MYFKNMLLVMSLLSSPVQNIFLIPQGIVLGPLKIERNKLAKKKI